MKAQQQAQQQAGNGKNDQKMIYSTPKEKSAPEGVLAGGKAKKSFQNAQCSDHTDTDLLRSMNEEIGQLVSDLVDSTGNVDDDISLAQWRDFLAKHRFNGDVVPDLEYICTLKDGEGRHHPFIPNVGFSALTGKAKCGKSTFLALFIAQLLRDNDGRNCICLNTDVVPDLRILLVDTEMSDVMIREKIWKVIQGQLTESERIRMNEKLIILSVREMTEKQRLDTIELALKSWRPTLTFIDGVTDLLESVNDEAGAIALVNKFGQWRDTYGGFLMGVIHANQTGNDNNPRGWIGAQWLRKCDYALYMKKDDPRLVVDAMDTRIKKCPALPLDITFDEQDRPMFAARHSREMQAADRTFWLKVFGTKQAKLRNSEIVKNIASIKGVLPRSAQTDLSNAVKDTWIIKEESTTKRPYYYINPSQWPEEE